MIHYLVTAALLHSIQDYLDARGRDMAERLCVLPYESLPDRAHLDRGTYILAGLEYLSPAMLQFVTELYDRFSVTEGFRFLNAPRRTLRRFELLDALHRRGLNAFRAVRAGGDLAGLRYPVFLRTERSHGGAVSPLLGSARAVDEGIGRAVLAGYRLRDLLLVEFCDTADAAGYYRKYAAFVVGERILARSLEYGPHWMLKHEHSEFSPALAREEVAYVETNPHERQLGEIRAIASVEYGRIDYSVLDGRVQTWEINLVPRIGRGPRPRYHVKPPDVERIREQSKAVFYAGFRAAFEAVDLPSHGPALEIDVDPALVRAARAEANGMPSPAGRLVRLLEPARPVLDPLAARVLPFLGRLARRAGR